MRDKLALLLPQLDFAFDVIEQLPTTMPAFQQGVHYDATCARELAVLVGIRQARLRLHALTLPPQTDDRQRAIDREEWSDYSEETTNQ